MSKTVTKKDALIEEQKRVRISSKRQMTIPKKFFEALQFNDKAECFVRGNELILRPVHNVTKKTKRQKSCNEPGKTKFEIHLFMGDKEVTREEMKKYAIRSNTVDRIVNMVVDNAIVVDENGVPTKSEEKE